MNYVCLYDGEWFMFFSFCSLHCLIVYHMFLLSHAFRQRQDDKWEHDLFNSDKPQLSSMLFLSHILSSWKLSMTKIYLSGCWFSVWWLTKIAELILEIFAWSSRRDIMGLKVGEKLVQVSGTYGKSSLGQWICNQKTVTRQNLKWRLLDQPWRA